jgi:hypothetical protein
VVINVNRLSKIKEPAHRLLIANIITESKLNKPANTGHNQFYDSENQQSEGNLDPTITRRFHVPKSENHRTLVETLNLKPTIMSACKFRV